MESIQVAIFLCVGEFINSLFINSLMQYKFIIIYSIPYLLHSRHWGLEKPGFLLI